MDRSTRGLGEELGVNLGGHEKSSSGSARNEEDPDGRPTVMFLERSDGQKTDGGGNRTASVDKTGDSTKRLVVSEDSGVRGQISSDGRSNDIVGSGK
jgi:hypothetical protein